MVLGTFLVENPPKYSRWNFNWRLWVSWSLILKSEGLVWVLKSSNAVWKSDTLVILMSDQWWRDFILEVFGSPDEERVCIYVCPSPLDLKLVVVSSSGPFCLGGESGDVFSLLMTRWRHSSNKNRPILPSLTDCLSGGELTAIKSGRDYTNGGSGGWDWPISHPYKVQMVAAVGLTHPPSLQMMELVVGLT